MELLNKRQQTRMKCSKARKIFSIMKIINTLSTGAVEYDDCTYAEG